jgi:phage minor structural protein
MTLITTIRAAGFINQLADEYVTTYTAENLTITQIVTALLAFQVLTPAITVGTIDPDVSRSIKVDGDTILRALYRLRDTVGGHIYVDANRALQWKTTIGEDKGQQIRYKKNLKGITREIDYTTLCNRLYAYGAGEGDARIKLSDAEGHEVDYVEDEGSQTEWGGIYKKTIVDKSITHPDTLLAWANLRLDELKNPRIAYKVDTIDLSASDEIDFSFEALQIGSTIKVIDEDLSIDVSAQVVKITHPDLLHPELMRIEVANRTKDITDVLGQVYDTQQLIQHIATEIGAGQVIVKGTFTVKDWVTDGETTIVGSNIETGTITADRLHAEVLVAENILISGVIMLSDWTHGEDPEYLDGAVVHVGSLSKDSLSFAAFDKGVDDLDDVGEGTTYKKVKATDISAGHIKLTSAAVIDGEWYNESGVVIDAAHGINIYGQDMAFTTRATKTGPIQCYVGANGRIIAGAGAVELSSEGINIFGSENALTTRASMSGTIQCYVGADGKIYAGAGAVRLGLDGIIITGAKLILKNESGAFPGELYVDTWGRIRLDPWLSVLTEDVYPDGDGVRELGALAAQWKDVHAVNARIGSMHVANELYIPAEP